MGGDGFDFRGIVWGGLEDRGGWAWFGARRMIWDRLDLLVLFWVWVLILDSDLDTPYS